MSLLEKIVKEKVENILRYSPSFHEEIEAYLGYPIRSKNDSNSQSTSITCSIFRCSALTEEELKTAEESVLEHLNNKQEACTFLASQEVWIKALHKLGLLQELNQEKKEKTAEAKTNDDHVAIDTAYEKGLREISAQVLSKITLYYSALLSRIRCKELFKLLL